MKKFNKVIMICLMAALLLSSSNAMALPHKVDTATPCQFRIRLDLLNFRTLIEGIRMAPTFYNPQDAIDQINFGFSVIQTRLRLMAPEERNDINPEYVELQELMIDALTILRMYRNQISNL